MPHPSQARFKLVQGRSVRTISAWWQDLFLAPGSVWSLRGLSGGGRRMWPGPALGPEPGVVRQFLPERPLPCSPHSPLGPRPSHPGQPVGNSGHPSWDHPGSAPRAGSEQEAPGRPRDHDVPVMPAGPLVWLCSGGDSGLQAVTTAPTVYT